MTLIEDRLLTHGHRLMVRQIDRQTAHSWTQTDGDRQTNRLLTRGHRLMNRHPAHSWTKIDGDRQTDGQTDTAHSWTQTDGQTDK